MNALKIILKVGGFLATLWTGYEIGEMINYPQAMESARVFAKEIMDLKYIFFEQQKATGNAIAEMQLSIYGVLCIIAFVVTVAAITWIVTSTKRCITKSVDKAVPLSEVKTT